MGIVTFLAGAGLDWDALVSQTVDAGCAGLECLSGIPGSVGGTPVQNVGAYGQEVSQTIQEVRVLDLQSLEIKTLSNADCRFTYRSSIFNRSERGRYIILRRVICRAAEAASQAFAMPICRSSSPIIRENHRLPR